MFGLKLIGKGAFTKCYQIDEDNVLLESIDNVKNCYANGWMPDNAMMPSIDFAPEKYSSNKIWSNRDVNYYVSPKYNKVTGIKKDLKPNDYQLVKQLQKLISGILLPDNQNNCAQELYELFENSNLQDDVKELLLESIDSLQNYGTDIWFEISPINIATDNNGDLILLDCWFFISELRNTRS